MLHPGLISGNCPGLHHGCLMGVEPISSAATEQRLCRSATSTMKKPDCLVEQERVACPGGLGQGTFTGIIRTGLAAFGAGAASRYPPLLHHDLLLMTSRGLEPRASAFAERYSLQLNYEV